MSEGQSFEQSHETPPQPEVDFKSVLEKGEIIETVPLEGHFHMSVVKIKDDGTALFRPDGYRYGAKIESEKNRSDIEMMASHLDRILGFNLIPPIAIRKVEGLKGTVQEFMQEAKPAYKFGGGKWAKLVDSEEIVKAAVFDYLIDARDRSSSNFLIDEKNRKIWLIDHDRIMFFIIGYSSFILTTAIEKGLANLSGNLLKAIGVLIGKIDMLLSEAEGDVRELLERVKERAKILVETGTLRTDNI